jgi:UDPglucose--hexose-1-phosphate uridylyltransferase
MLESSAQDKPEYDPKCYLCPGNGRVSGAVNPKYETTFVFDNDLPCVGQHAPQNLATPPGIYRNSPATGTARVICYHPSHRLTLAEMEPQNVVEVIRVWQTQYQELAPRPEINQVYIFENKGEAVGVSNPHPHGQLYATNFIMPTFATEVDATQRHRRETGRVLFQDILAAEKADGRRIILENDSAIAFLPYFARYAYEAFVAPKETHPSLATMSEKEILDFAEILRGMVIKFDNLWKMPFPYVMPLHQAPTDGGDYGDYHFYIQFLPPLRKPGLLKYLAGPEIGGGFFLSDTWPEDKAAELQAAADIHYTKR